MKRPIGIVEAREPGCKGNDAENSNPKRSSFKGSDQPEPVLQQGIVRSVEALFGEPGPLARLS